MLFFFYYGEDVMLFNSSMNLCDGLIIISINFLLLLMFMEKLILL